VHVSIITQVRWKQRRIGNHVFQDNLDFKTASCKQATIFGDSG
jgi:hypothetical protein